MREEEGGGFGRSTEDVFGKRFLPPDLRPAFGARSSRCSARAHRGWRLVQGWQLRVQGQEFRVWGVNRHLGWGSGFRVQGAGCQGLGFGVEGLWFRV